MAFRGFALGMLVAALAWAAAAFAEPPEGAVEIPADQLLVIQTSKGNILVAMAPEFAPGHVARMQELARDKFFDGMIFHRVIDGFMAQAGSPELSNVRRSSYSNLTAEFSSRVALGFTPASMGEIRSGRFTIGEREFTHINDDERPVRSAFPLSGGEVSVIDGYVVFHEPAGRAALSPDGTVMANIQHCPGVASMARQGAPEFASERQIEAAENSASTQFFLMRNAAPWLDRQYSPWGRVVSGQEVVVSLAVTDAVDYPDRIYSVRLVADLGEAKRPRAYWLPVDRDQVGEAARALAASTDGTSFDVCALAPEAHVENFSSQRQSVEALLNRE